MYEKNEISQYADEGNEPISLQDLERQFGEKKENYDEPFIIEEVVPENAERVEIEELIVEEEIKQEHYEKLRHALNELNPQELEIISRRFGLNNYSIETQKEISKIV